MTHNSENFDDVDLEEIRSRPLTPKSTGRSASQDSEIKTDLGSATEDAEGDQKRKETPVLQGKPKKKIVRSRTDGNLLTPMMSDPDENAFGTTKNTMRNTTGNFTFGQDEDELGAAGQKKKKKKFRSTIANVDFDEEDDDSTKKRIMSPAARFSGASYASRLSIDTGEDDPRPVPDFFSVSKMILGPFFSMDEDFQDAGCFCFLSSNRCN